MKIESFQGKYRFLSNFWPCLVVLDGVRYPTVEHAYQAAKTLNILDRRYIAVLVSPGDAKRVGKKVVIRPDWESVKVGVMEDLVRQKFSHPHLAKLLSETGDAELIEGNTWGDRFWGVCRGSGRNELGKILMRVRTEVQSGNAASSSPGR